MVHTGQLAAAASSRTRSSGSFHAGAPFPTLQSIEAGRRASFRRTSTTHRYTTFPTAPPRGGSDPSQHAASSSSGSGSASNSSHSSPDGRGSHSHSHSHSHHRTPLPIRQLSLLAFLSLAEQTALNSISPYLYYMVRSFPDVPPEKTGLYVGILASAFALAQLSTNLAWGYASDFLGRKPVLLLGTLCLAGCFAAFGLCATYWQIVLVHVAMGLLNGNAAVVPTVLGEVTDRSNQSLAFTWLPIIYSLGGITGPALGGLLAGSWSEDYPYLAPNVVSAALLLSSVVVLGVWFDETLDGADVGTPDYWGWLARWFWCLGRRRKGTERRGSAWSARWPRRGSTGPLDGVEEEDDDDEPEPVSSRERRPLLSGGGQQQEEEEEEEEHDHKSPEGRAAWRDILERRTVLLLLTYLVFQLANVSFNSLYPIFASAPPPTGRDLHPSTIGVSISAAGLATIFFQMFLFAPVKSRLGNLGTYRYALLALAASMALMPFVGYLDSEPLFGVGSGKVWLYAELGCVLVVKNFGAIGGLSCVMLLITNCAPSHATLGTLNGVAQTLSAAGRSFGPFVSGGLFTLAEKVHPKGEALAWGLFAGISFAGFLGTWAIRSDGLESDDWSDEGSEGGDEEAVL